MMRLYLAGQWLAQHESARSSPGAARLRRTAAALRCSGRHAAKPAAWLPHTWSEASGHRAAAADPDSVQAALAYLAAWGLAGLAVTYYYDADDLQARPAHGRVAVQAAASRQAAAWRSVRRAVAAGAALPLALCWGSAPPPPLVAPTMPPQALPFRSDCSGGAPGCCCTP